MIPFTKIGFLNIVCRMATKVTKDTPACWISQKEKFKPDNCFLHHKNMLSQKKITQEKVTTADFRKVTNV